MNAMTRLPPFIERTFPGCAPMASIAAPSRRDDGYVSYREYGPLKSITKHNAATAAKECK